MNNFFRDPDLIYLFVNYIEKNKIDVGIQFTLLRLNKLSRLTLFFSNCPVVQTIIRLKKLNKLIINSSFLLYPNLTCLINDYRINWLVHRYRRPFKNQGFITETIIINEIGYIDNFYKRYSEEIIFAMNNYLIYNETISMIESILFGQDSFNKPAYIKMHYEMELNRYMKKVRTQLNEYKLIIKEIGSENERHILCHNITVYHIIYMHLQNDENVWAIIEHNNFIDILKCIIQKFKEEPYDLSNRVLEYVSILENDLLELYPINWVNLTRNIKKYTNEIDIITYNLSDLIETKKKFTYDFSNEALFLIGIGL